MKPAFLLAVTTACGHIDMPLWSKTCDGRHRGIVLICAVVVRCHEGALVERDEKVLGRVYRGRELLAVNVL
jgi:hypothetical protein